FPSMLACTGPHGGGERVMKTTTVDEGSPVTRMAPAGAVIHHQTWDSAASRPENPRPGVADPAAAGETIVQSPLEDVVASRNRTPDGVGKSSHLVDVKVPSLRTMLPMRSTPSGVQI